MGLWCSLDFPLYKNWHFFIFVKASPDGANQVGWLGLIRWAVFKRTKYRPTCNMEVQNENVALIGFVFLSTNSCKDSLIARARVRQPAILAYGVYLISTG